MDETKKPSIDEVLGQPCLRDMRTKDDKNNEEKAEELLHNLKKCLPKCPPKPNKGEDNYPELPKGKLLYQTEEYDAPKEYITLQMNENKELVKKILDQKGCLTGHPEIPCHAVRWDLPRLDHILEAIDKEFPDPKKTAEKTKDITDRLSKLLGVKIGFSRSTNNLLVDTIQTKFDIREIYAAVNALAKLLPHKEAERIVSREIAKKIQDVL